MIYSSHNELSSLLQRVFEALVAHERDVEAAARLALWLESRELGGLELLLDALPRLDSPHPVVAQLHAGSPAHWTIDARAASLLWVAPGAGDFAIAGAVEHGFASVEIKHCSEPLAILPCLVDCAERDLAAATWWFEAESRRLTIARIGPGEAHPGYSSQSASGEAERFDSTVHLVCADADERLSQELAARNITVDETNAAVTVSAADFERHYSNTLQRGIPIAEDHYRQLCDVAGRLLVEASEESRRGAGE